MAKKSCFLPPVAIAISIAISIAITLFFSNRWKNWIFAWQAYD